MPKPTLSREEGIKLVKGLYARLFGQGSHRLPKPALSREERIELVKGLYARLAAGALREDDILSLSDAQYQRQGNFIRRLHSDEGLFDQHFSWFHPTYDVFRTFASTDVVLDVGSHWGYSAMAMRRQGCSAQIVSIEAMEANTRELAVLKDLEAGGYDFVHAAATDQEVELTIFVPSVNGYPNTGLSSTGNTLSDPQAFLLADFVTYHPAREGTTDHFQLVVQKVNGRRIDEITETLGITGRVRAIKLDVEGHEAPALRGARTLIARQRPLIMLEGANRDPGVVEEMLRQGYAHFERHEVGLVRHDAQSEAQDGFWIHRDEIAGWQEKGLIV